MDENTQTYIYQLRDTRGVVSEHPTEDSAIAAKWKKLNPHAYWVNAKPIVRDTYRHDAHVHAPRYVQATGPDYVTGIIEHGEDEHERDCGY